MRTSKEQPERASPYFALDEVKTLVGGLLVHAEGNGNVCCLTKSSMLRCIMSLTEMIYAVAESRVEDMCEGDEGDSQIASDNVC